MHLAMWGLCEVRVRPSEGSRFYVSSLEVRVSSLEVQVSSLRSPCEVHVRPSEAEWGQVRPREVQAISINKTIINPRRALFSYYGIAYAININLNSSFLSLLDRHPCRHRTTTTHHGGGDGLLRWHLPSNIHIQPIMMRHLNLLETIFCSISIEALEAEKEYFLTKNQADINACTSLPFLITIQWFLEVGNNTSRTATV